MLLKPKQMYVTPVTVKRKLVLDSVHVHVICGLDVLFPPTVHSKYSSWTTTSTPLTSCYKPCGQFLCCTCAYIQVHVSECTKHVQVMYIYLCSTYMTRNLYTITEKIYIVLVTNMSSTWYMYMYMAQLRFVTKLTAL